MNFKKTNIGNNRTVYINADLVQSIECDNETNEAIITMANGEIYHTTEDHEELLHDWEIELDSEEYENYIKRKSEKIITIIDYIKKHRNR